MAKMTGGKGWSFEPAGSGRAREEIVSRPAEKQRAKIRLEKRAKGKEVTVLSGFVLSDADRKALAPELKKACGGGGSDSAGHIEVQGDHREALGRVLAGKGWKVSP